MITFSILQLNKNCDNYRGKLFSDLDFTNEMFGAPNLNDYDVIFTGELLKECDELVMCEQVFQVFNINRPENFKGHSLSVSDIVKINDNYYFCDDFGFVKL